MTAVLALPGADEDRRRAARALLRRCVLRDTARERDAYRAVRRHADALGRWFSEHLGYRLVVEDGCARLLKAPPPAPREPRGLRTRTGVAFDRRRYALLCLLLATLEGHEGQTAVSILAEDLRVRATALPDLSLDFDRRPDRKAFVDVVRAAIAMGVLERQDGDVDSFVRHGTDGDALLRVRHRRLASVLALPRPPAMVESPAEACAEHYAETPEGAARRCRQRLLRRLVEEPVVYLDDLSPEEREYLRTQRPHLVRRLEDAFGFVVEVRQEALVVLDPGGESSDVDFAAVGTDGHATLLVAMDLARRARGGCATFGRGDVVALLERLAARHADAWRDAVSRSGDEISVLASRVLRRLADLSLVRRLPDATFRVLPGIARFTPVDATEAQP